MQFHQANPRDGGLGSGCMTCCCATTTARPGEQNKWVIDYSPWSVPLGGTGLTSCSQFEVELRDGCKAGANDASVTTPLLLTTPVNTPLNSTLVGAVTNPGAEALEFSRAQFGGASYGTVSIASDGTFVYTPNSNFTGYDRFWWQVEVGGGNPIIGETVIGVGNVAIPTASANGTPMVSVVKNSVKVDQRKHELSFALAVSPAAKVGCVYRLSIKKKAMDCDACYTHLSCFDITIAKC